MTPLEMLKAIQKVTQANRQAKLSDLVKETGLDEKYIIYLRFRKLSKTMQTALREGRLTVANAFALALCPNRSFEARALTEDPAEFVPALWSEKS